MCLFSSSLHGITDCGVFAVAFAYHAAIGDELERIIFDQGQMRKHLLRCFEKKELSGFPHKLLCSKGECKFQYIALHCYDHCRLPESYEAVIPVISGIITSVIATHYFFYPEFLKP